VVAAHCQQSQPWSTVMDLTGIGAVADLATTIVSKIWPDKTEAEKQQLIAAVSLVQGQIEINRTEAANPSPFVSGWRPACGWVCAAALGYQYVARPLLAFGFSASGHPLPEMPGIEGQLWELLAGMLGLGGLRSFDKSRGTA
jgi:hypothetical protein